MDLEGQYFPEAWTAQKGSVKPWLELDKCLAFWKENNPKQVLHIHSYSAEIQVKPTNFQTFFLWEIGTTA